MSEQGRWHVENNARYHAIVAVDEERIYYIADVGDFQALCDRLNTLEQKLAEADGFKALADDEWAGEIEDFIELDVYGELGQTREVCVACDGSQHVQQGVKQGPRPFPHRDACKKLRYDALTQTTRSDDGAEPSPKQGQAT